MIEGKGMIKVKSSKKISTDAEIASLRAFCVEPLHGLGKPRHLGFISRAAEAAGKQADQWLFTLSDLLVLVMLHPRCEHSVAQASWLPINREGESKGGNEPTTDGISPIRLEGATSRSSL